MTYKRVEQIALLAAGGLVLSSVLLWAPRETPDTAGLIGQALLFAVLLAGIRFGPSGGLAGAIGAALFFSALSVPELASTTEPNTRELVLLAVRILTYGAVGIIGGEIFVRLRYHLARIEGRSALDEWSRLYNQRYLAVSVHEGVARSARYGEDFSVVILDAPDPDEAASSPSRRRSRVRQAAEYLRSSVRVVDEVGRLDDGRYVVVLPHTGSAGATVVEQTLSSGLASVLGLPESSVSAHTLSIPGDAQGMDWFADSLVSSEPFFAELEGQSSSSESTLNPLAASTSSAPSSSTLNMSTAASPEGRTKQ